MKKIYAITMWSGGIGAKKWQAFEKPELLPSGTGIRFICRNTKLTVELIGSVSVEEYESGKEEIETVRERPEDDGPEISPRADNSGDRIDRLF